MAALLAAPAYAQVSAPPADRPQGNTQSQTAGGNGTVVFSRSDSNPGSAASQHPAQSAQETAPPAVVDAMTNETRLAPVFTAYDFEIHLQPDQAVMQVQLRATIRNAGDAPLSTLPLQLGSSLHFEHIRMDGQASPLRFAVHSVASDADHTGALTEAVVQLPSPLGPGAQATFVIDYSGTIEPSTARLDRIGTPASLAAESDWDRIGDGFTGLRGFGNTVWYPVASVPAILGDGITLFHEIGRQQLQNSDAMVHMDLTVEFKGDAPNFAVLDGHRVMVGAPASMPSASFPGVLRVSLPSTRLGFTVPSLVLAARQDAGASAAVQVAAQPGHAEAAPKYLSAASLLDPMYADWLNKPISPYLLIDLPIEGGAAAADGDALLLSLNQAPPSALAENLAGPLTHSRFHSPRAWLQSGVEGLMTVVWTERTAGQEKAIEELAGPRSALALAEPASPGTSAGEPLLSATDPIFYRAKATDVLWMLRGIAGDTALASALRAYNPEADTTPGYFEHLVARAMQAEAPPSKPDSAGNDNSAGDPVADLHAFFQDWVYSDPGLPDLAITNVFSSKTGAGDQWLVAVEVSNTGYAEAEVPVTVRSANTTQTIEVRVPARGNLSRRILLLGAPLEVQLNDGSVPEVEASIHKRTIQ
jgi:hypothetical protein